MSSILQVLKKQDETAQKMEELRKGQSEIRERQIQDAEMRLSKKRREMLNDFSKIQPDIPFKKHLSLRQNGTGVWLLQSSEFQKFMKSPKSKLWLYGIPGAGKSVLSATVIEHTSGYRTEKIASAYFFSANTPKRPHNHAAICLDPLQGNWPSKIGKRSTC